jgi:NAD(P)-dependent dehydrogenase (short-subunit alcohol dehydrogenase family)
MGRFATAAECARLALFLACADSSAMTGQALNVTAGVIMT